MFTLAIVGRPNVGKSTLFNRLAGKKLAIVDDTPGVTRDWRDAEAHLFDRSFRVIDTAGLEESFDDSIPARMRQQTEAALKQADAILFLIDGREGVMPIDKHFAQWLRRQKKPVLLGVNKCENERAVISGLGEAYSLGFGDPIPMSAEHNEGLDSLYYALQAHFPEEEDIIEEDKEHELTLTDAALDELEGLEDFDFAAGLLPEDSEEIKAIKIAIVGRPNVGKSTLLNALVGEQRSMTGPEAGITRDAIAVKWEHKGKTLRLVDTAGMRKKSSIVNNIEKMAVDDSLRAIRLAQVVVLVLDAALGLEKQDQAIADLVLREGRALVIALNKWDLIEDKEEYLKEFRADILHQLGQVPDVPFVTLSAIRGANTGRVLDVVMETYDIWNKRVKTATMNRWLAGMESQNPPPLVGGRTNRLRYITQIKARPPTFAIWVSYPNDLSDSYKRYLMNGLRRDFGMPGIPIRLLMRTSKNPYV
ncbi:MAG: ribosome biogenesis GTPase Der [Alphaproteobacteria bacterium]|nr:ribosome biogenesis GTPase Der [Alphaproteobacteria bacterium]